MHTEALQQLNRLRVVALLDFLLLLALVAAAVTDSEGVVNVLGPVHGVGYLFQLYLCVRGAGEGWWGWWFPALVVVTLGPPGALLGDLRIRRRFAGA